MRKYFAVLLAVLLILSFAVTAFAEDKTEITIGGKILVRGWYFDNVTAFPATTCCRDTNIRLSFLHHQCQSYGRCKSCGQCPRYGELETAKGGSANSGLFYWGDAAGL